MPGESRQHIYACAGPRWRPRRRRPLLQVQPGEPLRQQPPRQAPDVPGQLRAADEAPEAVGQLQQEERLRQDKQDGQVLLQGTIHC